MIKKSFITISVLVFGSLSLTSLAETVGALSGKGEQAAACSDSTEGHRRTAGEAHVNCEDLVKKATSGRVAPAEDSPVAPGRAAGEAGQ